MFWRRAVLAGTRVARSGIGSAGWLGGEAFRMGNSMSSSSLGKPGTAPADQIQELFHGMDINYTAVELDMLEYGSQFQDALYKMTGERTVPRVFVNGTFIGGATDTHRLHKEGKLLPLVHQCYLKKKNKNFSDSKMSVI
uniref:Glutaredoxin 2 n=1 Tax=Rousettus aegyptiacus TaxID=9407 RepID=A0A7J8B8T0_ROUAE|nr:glutaredoxin 2 [Rousettus aegyptiacus]